MGKDSEMNGRLNASPAPERLAVNADSLQASTPIAAQISAQSQLGVNAYFSQALFQQELQTLFQHGPRYVGHTQSVPQIGDYYTLAQEANGRALLNTPSGVQLVSNICRHRQALMLQGRGNTGANIVCPLHRWTYDATGQRGGGATGVAGHLIGAPQFGQDPCLHLKNTPIQTWNGLVFERNAFDVAAQLAGLACAKDLDFSGYVLGHVEQHHCAYNWKTFIEVYLEDYHVAPFHPGLGQFVSCQNLQWEFGAHYSVQTVGLSPQAQQSERAGTPIYQHWQRVLNRYHAEQGGKVPKHGAIWFTLYPNIMVEWYPEVLTVSTLYPKGPQETLNVVEFFYPEEIAAFEPELVAAQRAAYMETCAEDDEIALRMDAGRNALLQRGEDDAGPYQSPLEDGMVHFHQWLRRHVPKGFLSTL